MNGENRNASSRVIGLAVLFGCVLMEAVSNLNSVGKRSSPCGTTTLIVAQ